MDIYQMRSVLQRCRSCKGLGDTSANKHGVLIGYCDIRKTTMPAECDCHWWDEANPGEIDARIAKALAKRETESSRKSD